MEKQYKVTAKRCYTGIKIYINDTLHLWLKEDIQSVQSWRNYGKYAIEYSHPTGTITVVEYDREQLWTDMLVAIDSIL